MATQVSSKDIFKPILFFFQLCGCHPQKTNRILKSLTVFATALNIFWSIFIILQIVMETGGTTSRANNYANFIITSQLATKSINLLKNHTELEHLLETINQFWSVNEVSERATTYNRQNMILLYIKVYSGAMLACCLVVGVAPGCSSRLLYGMWFFDWDFLKAPYFQLIYLLQVFSLFVNAFCMLSMDLLFLAVVGLANIQLDILRRMFLTMSMAGSEKEVWEMLKRGVRHHNVILGFLKNVECFFSMVILKQFSDTIILYGIYLYLIQEDFQVLFLICMLGTVLQTFLFSLSGQIIQDQSCRIGSGAFESGWERVDSIRLRQGLMMVIQRSNRNVKISAGGWIDLSFATSLKILKMAFSLLAVLRSTNRQQ